VAAYDFVFALRLSGTGGDGGMLQALAAVLLEQVGCPSGAAADLAAALSAAVAGHRSSGDDLDVRFLARSGELEIVASHGGAGPFWRGACRLP
jgi:hypothetical protein